MAFLLRRELGHGEMVVPVVCYIRIWMGPSGVVYRILIPGYIRWPLSQSKWEKMKWSGS